MPPDELVAKLNDFNSPELNEKEVLVSPILVPFTYILFALEPICTAILVSEVKSVVAVVAAIPLKALLPFAVARNFIVFEIDPVTAQAARERVANTQPPLPGLVVEQGEMEL